MTRAPKDHDGAVVARPPAGRRTARLPLVGEHTLPWCAGALAAASITALVFVAGGASTVDLAALVTLLAGTLAAAGLVTARSNRALEANDREERARPSAEELEDIDDPLSSSYLEGMVAFAGAMRELIEHARAAIDADDPAKAELDAAAEDTDALLGLLSSSSRHTLSLYERATLHAVCTLWEAGHPAIEALAARVDGAWHRRWRARTVVEARLRHGTPQGQVALPYRA